MIPNILILNSMGCYTFDRWLVNSFDLSHNDELAANQVWQFRENGLLLLEGGADIGTDLYGEENRWSSPAPRRDRREIALYDMAREFNVPILGICRGHQLIAALNGGTLYQDIYRDGATKGHSDGKVNTFGIMAEWYPEGLFVNSMHHQAVKKVPSNAVVVARDAKDNLIEALDYPGDKIFSVQWHPEFMSDEVLLRHIVTRLFRKEL